MTGELLEGVNLEMLEDLGIDHEHRQPLFSAIQELFPPLSYPILGSAQGASVTGSESQCMPMHPASVQVLRSSIGSHSASSRHDGERFVGRRSSQNDLNPSNHVPSNPQKVTVKFPKLVLTLQANDFSQEGSIDFHRLRFQKIDPYVKVLYSGHKTNEYILKFQDTNRAQEAYLKGLQMGLKMKRWFPARPSPGEPIEYISLTCLTIRVGKKSPNIVGWLGKGLKVTVNQLKSKRARLIKPNKEIWGWVSMYSKEGTAYLAPVNETEEVIFKEMKADKCDALYK